MVKSTRFLKSLRKTYSNWCATLDSMIPRSKIRNIIDNNDDNDQVDKTTGQLTRARSGSEKSKYCAASFFVYPMRFYNFAQLWLVDSKQAEPIRCFQPNVAFPAKSAVPLQVSIISVLILHYYIFCDFVSLNLICLFVLTVVFFHYI